jgi:tetratricopeptide (TPR) repeat protein
LEEANLLHARSLAQSAASWSAVVNSMQGLDELYDHTGRRADWARLVGEIVPDFVDPVTEGPLPAREDQWSLVTEYRVRLAMDSRRWNDAERLQKMHVEWNRQRAAGTLSGSPDTWDAAEKNRVRTFAASLHQLSQIQREIGLARCVDGYQEALALAERIGDAQAAAICAFNLGQAFSELELIRDLSLAEKWCRRSLDLHAQEDRIGRAKCLSQLGSLAYRRFLAAREAQRQDDCVAQLTQAARNYEQALTLLPADAVGDLDVTHNQLGILYHETGQMDAALSHFQESVRYSEIQGDRIGAGQTRANVARALALEGRFADAREWARCALRDFEACENADQEVVETLEQLKAIESHLPKTEQPS